MLSLYWVFKYQEEEERRGLERRRKQERRKRGEQKGSREKSVAYEKGFLDHGNLSFEVFVYLLLFLAITRPLLHW